MRFTIGVVVIAALLCARVHVHARERERVRVRECVCVCVCVCVCKCVCIVWAMFVKLRLGRNHFPSRAAKLV